MQLSAFRVCSGLPTLPEVVARLCLDTLHCLDGPQAGRGGELAVITALPLEGRRGFCCGSISTKTPSAPSPQVVAAIAPSGVSLRILTRIRTPALKRCGNWDCGPSALPHRPVQTASMRRSLLSCSAFRAAGNVLLTTSTSATTGPCGPDCRAWRSRQIPIS